MDTHPCSPIFTTQTLLKPCTEWIRELMQIRMSLATWALILFVPVWVSLQAQIGWDQEQETSETEKTEQVFFFGFFFLCPFHYCNNSCMDFIDIYELQWEQS